tara:strand:+ start:695 stop:1882 length:1188 start_codon:yes stop_codon:yes gene_type:complete
MMTNTKLHFFIIIFFSIILRILSIEYFGDKQIDNEWKIILFNLENNSLFGYRQVQDQIFPNIFMPPLYPLFLYLIKILNPFDTFYLKVILYIQMITSILAIIYLRKILLNFFTNHISNIGTLIFSLFPLFIYGSTQISSISLQVFLIVIYFYFLFRIILKIKFKYLIYFSISSGLLMLLRGEFFIIFLLTLLFIYMVNKNFNHIIVLFFASLILISPYLVRNYYIFEKVTITKSLGFNLWKGNNLYSLPEGSEKIYDKNMELKIKEITLDKKYDYNIDEIYKSEAIKNIKAEPTRYLILYLKKLFAFMFIDFDSTYPNYYNFFHIIPKIFISIGSLLGLIFLLREKNILNYFTLYYLFNVCLFSVFFILPRYSLALLPVQIFLICFLIKKLKINI